MFYDRIMNNWPQVLLEIGSAEKQFSRINVLTWDDVHEMLSEAVVIDIENVAQYLNTVLNNNDPIPDVPNMRPIFPVTWFEWNTQLSFKNLKIVRPDGSLHNNYIHPVRSYGCLLFINGEDDEHIAMGALSLSDSKSEGFFFNGLEAWECDPEGKYVAGWPLSDYLISAATGAQQANARIMPPAQIPLLALSFIHCKNTTLLTNTPPPRLQEARVKKGKRPLVTYKTLDIRPVKRILETEGRLNQVGFKQSLHICRGHFKDYTERGLFGKYYGIYWWDSQVRGDIKEGQTLKDYRVQTK